MKPNDISQATVLLIVIVVILVLISQFGVPEFTSRLQQMLVQAASQK